MRNKQSFSLVLGPLLLLLAAVLIPNSVMDFKARISIGTVLWMGCWWIILPVSAAVTGMIPVVVNALFSVIPMSSIISCYASEIVILLFGADLVTACWEQTGLDKRLALKTLCIIGPSLTQQIIVWFLLSAVMSMFLPNAVVCAVLCPIAFSMLKSVLKDDADSEKISAVILAAIAWAAGIGGLGTPLGGAMNLVAVEYLEDLLDGEFMYTDWALRLLPILAVLVLIDIFYLVLIKPKGVSLPGSKSYFSEQYQEMPKMSRDETISMLMFLMATLLAFCRELFADLLPGLKPAYIFAIFGFAFFFINKQDGEPFLTWKTAEKSVGWSLLLLFAGGLAAGKLVSDSGAAEALAKGLITLNLDGGFMTILIFTVFTVIVAEISSNTAAASICTPIILNTVQSMGLDPVPYVLLTAAAFNVAYMLPTSIRAIPVSYGLKPSYMFKNGMALTFSSILIISIIGALFVKYWAFFFAL